MSQRNRRDELRRPPLTFSEAVEYLGVTPRWLRRQVAERRIPFVKANRLLLFLAEDLDDYIVAHRTAGDR